MDRAGGERLYRRCRVPDRIVGDRVVTARPGSDEAVVLGGMAALVWVALDDWCTGSALAAELAHEDLDRPLGERAAVVEASVEMLLREGLLERR